MQKKEKILITGGAGFLGSSIAKVLCEKYDIVLYDNFFRNSLDKTDLKGKVTVVIGDILNASLLNECIDGCDYVIHCAAIAGIDTVALRPVDTMMVDGIGALNALEACKNHGSIKKVLIFSTSEVFGKNSFMSQSNGDMNIGPLAESRWIYAVSKLFGEHLAVSFRKQYGVNAIIIRPFNIYGPTQSGDSALMTFVKSALQGNNLVVRNGGAQIRAWCYVDDFVAGVKTLLEADGLDSYAYNIGNNKEAITIYQLAKTVRSVLNSDVEIIFEKERVPDVEIRIPDTSEMEKLGFCPNISLEDGISRVANELRNQIL